MIFHMPKSLRNFENSSQLIVLKNIGENVRNNYYFLHRVEKKVLLFLHSMNFSQVQFWAPDSKRLIFFSLFEKSVIFLNIHNLT